MALDQKKLEKLLSKPDTKEQVVKFFAGASEADRKSLAGYVGGWLKEQLKVDREMWRADFSSNKLLSPAAHAAYACCGLSQLKSLKPWVVADELAYQLLRDRKPDWIDQWAEMRAQQGEDWDVIRRLVAEGFCRRPRHDNYTRAMIDAKPAAEVFLKDPHLVEEEFWRIFEVPDSVRHESFFGLLGEPWSDIILTLEKKGVIDRQRLFDSCFSALNMGFNRERVKFFFDIHDRLKPTKAERRAMFDTYCGLLDHQFPTVVQFAFDRLRELDKDQLQDETQLAAALRGALRQPTKKMGQAALKWMHELIKRNPKAATSICLAVADGLTHSNKDVQAEVWQFLSKNATDDTALTDRVSAASAGTTASVRKEINAWLQRRSAAVDTASAPVAASATVQGELDQLVNSAKRLNKQLAGLLGVTDLLVAIKQRKSLVPPCTFDGTEMARLPHFPPLTPITSLEELVDVAARVLENGLLIDDAERVVDALARFAIRNDASKRKLADPIVKRAWQLIRHSHDYSFVGCGVHRELRPLIIAWACAPDEISRQAAKVAADRSSAKKKVTDFPAWCDTSRLERAGFAGFLGLRARQICQALYAGESLQLLGTATHCGGWIDPLVLVQRAKAWASRPDAKVVLYDQILSLLRLAPDNRRAALKKASKLKGEYGVAVRYACGGQATSREMKTASLWIAAARARHPWHDDAVVEKKFPNLGVDAGRAAIYETRYDAKGEGRYYAKASPQPKPHVSYSARRNVDFALPTAVAHEHDIHCDLNFGRDTKPIEQEITNMAATVWPIARESYFRVDAFNPLAVHLAPLFDPCTPLREMSNAALTLSLGSGYAEQRILAVDVAIAAIDDGRFDPQPIGRLLGMMVNHANRYAKSLPQVADASPLHAFQIAQALVEMLSHLPKKLPSSFGGLLQVLLELMQEHNIPIEQEKARSFLSAFSGSGKAAKVAKKVVDFEPDVPLDLEAIHARALAGRLNAGRALST